MRSKDDLERVVNEEIAQDRPILDRVVTREEALADPDKMLAAVHKATGSRTWQADADLAVLTLNLNAGTADLAVVRHVDTGDTGSAFSYATDLMAVDINPTSPQSRRPTSRIRRGPPTARPPWTPRNSPTSPGWPWAQSALHSVPYCS